MGERRWVGAEGLAHDQLLTDPDEAVNFVKLTNVDALAIAIGTSHGAYNFSCSNRDTLNMKRISEINDKLQITSSNAWIFICTRRID